MNDPKIIVALDFDSEKKALELVSQINPKQCRVKVGKELFTRTGPQFVERLHNMNFDVFLDLKFHDIPNTVAKACNAAVDLGVWMVNLHALGGRKMMQAAREAVPQTSSTRLIAVTILTSMSGEDLQEVGIGDTPANSVINLAKLAQGSGLDGIVCSPLEVAALRAECGPDFLCVTPGVRPSGADVNDQKRIMTPTQAIKAGSSYLVIGRPITQAPDPQDALEAIFTEIE